MRHVCFIIFRRGMITVIDSVTSSLSSSVIGAYRSEIQQGAVRATAEGPHCERYRRHLMGVNCNGAGVRVHVCVCGGGWGGEAVTNMAHSTLCHVDDGGVDCGGSD